MLVQEHKARDVSDIIMQKLQVVKNKLTVRILKSFQFDAVFLKLTARESGEIEKDI